MATFFFGASVRPGKEHRVIPPLNTTLHLSQVTLPWGTSAGPVTLWAEASGQRFALCTLERGRRASHWSTDLCFTASNLVQFTAEGTGALHLTGYYQILDNPEEKFPRPHLIQELKALAATTEGESAPADRVADLTPRTTDGPPEPAPKKRRTATPGGRHVSFAPLPVEEPKPEVTPPAAHRKPQGRRTVMPTLLY
eukprot:GGOE01042928.1.p1 GENE.GGOE01042928.1~~GGOE01042928.1.p1  ORF type:complete len:203 (-),score=42.38 GGOE01042928.1:296-883(-)